MDGQKSPNYDLTLSTKDGSAIKICWGTKILNYIKPSHQSGENTLPVESSLFVEDQYSWLSWVNLAHKLTSP